MKPLVIYHAHCMDGAGAALAAWLKFGEAAEYRAANYGEPAPTDEEVHGRDVYILDFSYSRGELLRLSTAVGIGKLQVLDHHKTAEASLKDLYFCEFVQSLSGAVMAWRYFHGQETPRLFAYIQDRDLWKWEMLDSREISAALSARGGAEDFRALIPIWQRCNSGRRGEAHMLEELLEEGRAILRYQEQQIRRIVEAAEEVMIGGLRALAVSSPVLQSEVGEALAFESARRGGDAVGVAYYRDGKAGKWRVSLRSRDIETDQCDDDHERIVRKAPDVSAIAKTFGGGGHARAAGFECNLLPDWMVTK